jgi:Mg/Co/Ni transporter MgtE
MRDRGYTASEPAPLPDLLARTLLAAVAAVVANVLVRALAIAVFDIPDAFEHLALRAVIVSTLAGVFAAALVFAVIARFARDPVRTFVIVAAVALVLSLLAPLSVGLQDPPEYPGTDAASVGTLMLMHVLTAAIVVAIFSRPGRSPGSRR